MNPLLFLQSISIPTSTDDVLKVGTTWSTRGKDFLFEYGPKIVGAIIIYIIGQWIIKKLVAALNRSIAKSKMDVSLSKFVVSLLKATLQIVLFLSIAGVLNVNILGFTAILAGAAVGIGAAMNGSLGNLAGGVMMMIFKPFKVGDIIEAQDKTGMVQELGIFNTVILTPENKTVILPNGALSTGVITNFKTAGALRVDIDMAISNDQNIDLARKVALDVMANFPGVLGTPAPSFAVASISDFMTKVTVRPYTDQENYWDVYFGITEAVKKAFDQHGIQGPTPTRIVYNK